jgi:aminopeptidase N
MVDRNRIIILKEGTKYSLVVKVHNYPEDQINEYHDIVKGYRTYEAAAEAAKVIDTYVGHSGFQQGVASVKAGV